MDRTTPLRYRERIRDDRASAHEVLDEALFCHVAFVVDGTPRVLPTMHVRVGEMLYVHGSTGMRTALSANGAGLDVCVAVTLLDGLAFARSQFHHSVNYRSCVVHGVAMPVQDRAAKREVLTALVDKLAPGRSADSRPPTVKELAQTAVLGVPLTEASTKVRSAGILDDPEDLALPHWAGVLPLRMAAEKPESATDNLDIPVPDYLTRHWSWG